MKITDTFCDPKKAVEFKTPSGSRFKKQLVGKLNLETGNIDLTEVGELDIYAEIQSHAGESDIYSLMARAEAGDLSAFSSAIFGDFTEMPTSYAEALNVVIEAEREFYHLPQEVRDKFDNDWHKYITRAGSDEWYGAFGIGDAEPQKDDVKENSDVEKQ